MANGARGIGYIMRINEPLVYKVALQAVAAGGMAVNPLAGNGKGRPSGNMQVGNNVLNREEFELYRQLYEFGCQCRALVSNDLMTNDEIQAHIKDAAPKIMKRMVDMALVTDDLKALKSVHSDLMDRGYGKAADKIDMTVSHKDIRNVWKQIEQRKTVNIEAIEVFDSEDEVIEGD